MQRRQRWPHALARGHPRNSYHARVRRTYPPVVACGIFWALALLSKAMRKCVVVLSVSFFGCSSPVPSAPDRDRYYSAQGASKGGIEVHCVFVFCPSSQSMWWELASLPPPFLSAPYFCECLCVVYVPGVGAVGHRGLGSSYC